jgi:hypothetical protein
MATNIKTTHTRGPNAVAQHASEKLVSADGKRTALGRYVKRAEANHMFSLVKVWTLRARGADGKVKTVRLHCSEEAAREWVSQ